MQSPNKNAQQDLFKQVQQLEYEMAYLADMVKHNAWITYVSGDPINQITLEVEERMIALTKEYNQSELELLQEKTCTKK